MVYCRPLTLNIYDKGEIYREDTSMNSVQKNLEIFKKHTSMNFTLGLLHLWLKSVRLSLIVLQGSESIS
jgi:hypothetical protein